MTSSGARFVVCVLAVTAAAQLGCGETSRDSGAGAGGAELGRGGTSGGESGSSLVRGGETSDGDQAGRASISGGRPACDGFCLLGSIRLVELASDPVVDDARPAVDDARDALYMQNLRLDASRPEALKWEAIPASNVVAVNPRTGRYASAKTGDGESTLLIYNRNDTLYDTQVMPGRVWGASVDPLTGHFFVTTRDENDLVVYDEASRSVIATQSLDEAGAQVAPFAPVFDASTGNVFVSRYFLSGQVASVYRALIFDSSYERIGAIEGNVLAADGAHDLYVSADHEYGPARLEIRDSRDLSLSAAQLDTDAYWVSPDLVSQRLHVQQLERVVTLDRTTGEVVAELPIGADTLLDGIVSAPGDDRVYARVFNFSETRSYFFQSVLVFGTR